MAASCTVTRAFTARPCSQRPGRRAAVAPQAFFSNISKSVSKTIKGGVEKAVETVEKAAPTQGGTQSGGSQSGGAAAAGRPTAVNIRDAGSHSRKGTVRKQNEDRFALEVADGSLESGVPEVYAAVFDGHGGSATAEWLQDNLLKYVEKFWDGENRPEQTVSEAFRKADAKILSPKGGFMGMVGERGIGGSKCGSTAAVALVYKSKSGTSKLLTANSGDARILLVRGNTAIQLTEDHVPDNEDERNRIERFNPNPKLPLVRYVGGTWRVGGLLALSRAFGDAYLKGNDQFEGVSYYASDTYASGFGVIAEPYTTLTDLTSDDSWLIVCSDGLLANEERGGGGGLDNADVVDTCKRMSSQPCDAIAAELAKAAVAKGSTDDVTVLVLKLK
jgi:protein phosphatase 1K